jgi:hypothetical protein
MRRLRIHLFRLICLMATVDSATAGQAEFGIYSNRHFGYSVRYPSSLLRPAATHSAAGQAFVSVVGHAGFRVFAARLDGRSLEELANEAQAICPDRRPSYRVVKPRLAAVSCRVGDHIVYQKTLLQGEIEITVRGEYPATERRTWDPVVTSIARSMSADPRPTQFPG